MCAVRHAIRVSEEPLHQQWARRPVLVTDAAAIVGLAEAIARAASVEAPMSAADVSADLDHPDVDLDRDTLAVVDYAGAFRAYVIVYDEAPGRTDGEILVDPDLDQDTSDALLDECIGWFVDAVLAHAERRGLTSTVAVLAAAQAETGMFEAYARHGFSYTRTFWRMGLQLSDPYPKPEVVPGMRLERVNPGDAGVVGRLHELTESAFAEHYGHVPVPIEVFARQFGALSGLDAEAIWITVDEATETDAAYVVGSDRRADEGRGYISLLGVARPFRGRGLAKHLLATAFAYYASRGLDAVELGVDAENHTGATQLYQSVGMREWEAADVWELALSLDDPDV